MSKLQPVLDAIDRWETGNLVDAETASRLRAEAAESVGHETRRLSQYVLASAGGIVLVMAAALFLDWSWPRLSPLGRSGMLAVIGVAVVGLGIRVEERIGWRPAAYLMQAGGLLVVFTAAVFTGEVWEDGTLQGGLVAALGVAITFVVGWLGAKRNDIVPALAFPIGLAFVALVAIRGFALRGGDVLWVMDAVYGVCILGFLRLIATDLDGERHPWALNAFVMGLFLGFFLVGGTGQEILDLDDATIYPIDLWLFGVVALTLWGFHRGTDHIRKFSLSGLYALEVFAWIPMGLVTADVMAEGNPELALFLVSGAGVAAFWHSERHGLREPMATSGIALIVGLWYWAVERAGALGAALALAATASLLFWLSGRGKRAS